MWRHLYFTRARTPPVMCSQLAPRSAQVAGPAVREKIARVSNSIRALAYLEVGVTPATIMAVYNASVARGEPADALLDPEATTSAVEPALSVVAEGAQ